jgi:hypothetical protein
MFINCLLSRPIRLMPLCHSRGKQMSAPKFPHVHVQLADMDGNSFAILGRVIAAMKEAGADQREIDAYRERAMASDYGHLLRVTAESVDVSFS